LTTGFTETARRVLNRVPEERFENRMSKQSRDVHSEKKSPKAAHEKRADRSRAELVWTASCGKAAFSVTNNDIFRIPAPEGEPRLARRHSRPRSLTVPQTAREPRVS
jgi:hypothetical protein